MLYWYSNDKTPFYVLLLRPPKGHFIITLSCITIYTIWKGEQIVLLLLGMSLMLKMLDHSECNIIELNSMPLLGIPLLIVSNTIQSNQWINRDRKSPHFQETLIVCYAVSYISARIWRCHRRRHSMLIPPLRDREGGFSRWTSKDWYVISRAPCPFEDQSVFMTVSDGQSR